MATVTEHGQRYMATVSSGTFRKKLIYCATWLAKINELMTISTLQLEKKV